MKITINGKARDYPNIYTVLEAYKKYFKMHMDCNKKNLLSEVKVNKELSKQDYLRFELYVTLKSLNKEVNKDYLLVIFKDYIKKGYKKVDILNIATNYLEQLGKKNHQSLIYYLDD